MEALEKGTIYTAVIDGYSSDGLGIARVNGAVVFVPHAVRGEEIDLRITKVMKTSCAGEIVKIRTSIAGPHGAGVPPCGQMRRLRLPAPDLPGGAVGQAPAGAGRSDPDRRAGPCRWRRSWGRRTRSIIATKASTPWGQTAPSAFFQARTHKVVPIRRCLIQTEAADRTAQAVGEWMRALQDPRL